MTTTRRSHDQTMDEWVRLHAAGLNRAQAADQLGMTYHALRVAIAIAARRGDPRGFRGRKNAPRWHRPELFDHDTRDEGES